ncbi:MAG TPA: hypothetical protein VF941_20340 [Clostridia bacterium]
MDWAKVKVILIGMFLILNIFLFVNIINFNPSEVKPSDMEKDTVSILSERGISLSCKVPDYLVDGGIKLNCEVSSVNIKDVCIKFTGNSSISEDDIKNGIYEKDGKKIALSENNTIILEFGDREQKLNNEKTTKLYLIKLLSRLNIPTDSYICDSFKSSDGRMEAKFVEKYDDFIVYDNYIDIRYDGTHTRIEYRYNKISGLIRENTVKKTVPAYLVLLKNYFKGSVSKIIKIDAGFKITNESRNVHKTPVWRIESGDGAPKYFDIYTGIPVQYN